MSPHFSAAGAVVHTFQLPRGRTVQYRVLYLSATPIPTLWRLILVNIGEAVVARRPFHPSQARLGELMGRSVRTIKRAVRGLAEAGLIRIKRRGNRLSNVYLLARRLWHSLTGGLEWPGKAKQLGFRGLWRHRAPAAVPVADIPERWRRWAEAQGCG